MVCKCLPIELEFYKQQLNYAHYLENLADTRLVKQVYLAQMNILKPIYFASNISNFWLHGAEEFAASIFLPDPLSWTKSNVKSYVYDFWLHSCQKQLCERRILKYMKDFILPKTEKVEYFSLSGIG